MARAFELVLVQLSLTRPRVQRLRVRRGSYVVADCSTVAEVAAFVDLADLVSEQRVSGGRQRSRRTS